jgi:hypothetical protein
VRRNRDTTRCDSMQTPDIISINLMTFSYSSAFYIDV